MRIIQSCSAIFAVVAAAFLGGCGNPQLELANLGIEKQIEPASYGAFPSERQVDKGKRAYRQGDYGLAEQAFRAAVEQEKDNPEAWLGLAASYDQLKRFDLAERAYDVVVKQVGHTPTVLNNLAYHYYLAGKQETAKQTVIAAAEAAPQNTVIKNNLALIQDPKAVKAEKAEMRN